MPNGHTAPAGRQWMAGAGPASLALALPPDQTRPRPPASQSELVAELGYEALCEPGFPRLLLHAVETVARGIEAEIVRVDELLSDGELLVRAAFGTDGAHERAVRLLAGTGSQAGFTLAERRPVTSDDLQTEARFRPAPCLTRAGARPCG